MSVETNIFILHIINAFFGFLIISLFNKLEIQKKKTIEIYNKNLNLSDKLTAFENKMKSELVIIDGHLNSFKYDILANSRINEENIESGGLG